MKEKARIILGGIISMCVFCLCVLPAQAGPPKPLAVKLLPDLVVDLKLSTKKHTGFYQLFLEITVTNKGQASAKNFIVKYFEKRQGEEKFRYYGESGNISLAPGKTWTLKAAGDPVTTWHQNKKGKAGFRVTVFYDGEEKDKQNNTATKLFPTWNVK